MIETLKQFPPHTVCPICGTNKSTKTLLVPVDGSLTKDKYQAILVHRKCLISKLSFNRDYNLFYVQLGYVKTQEKNENKKK